MGQVSISHKQAHFAQYITMACIVSFRVPSLRYLIHTLIPLYSITTTMVEAGVTMEDFTLLKMIGKGTYGKVLLVKKNNSDEIFAMKMLKKDYIARRNQVAHTRTERNILEKVNHPNVVKLRYAFQNQKKLYFVLEYCPGGELFFHLSRAGKFTEASAVFYCACVVVALEHLHRLNIVYRE